MKRFLLIILPFLCWVMAACTHSAATTTSTNSSVAQLTAFAFAANDSFPGLKEAVFTIKELLDTGLVYNKDSIRYGTRLDSVVPKYTFYTSPYTVVLHMRDVERRIDTTFTVSTNDTLDFTCEEIYLTILSADKSNTKVYRIQPTVHKVDPDLYTWDTLQVALYSATEEAQQMMVCGSRMLILTNDGLTTRLYASSDMGQTWQSPVETTGLPGDCRVRSVVAHAGKLYYLHGTTLYMSTDGVTWTTTDYSGDVAVMHASLFSWIDDVWVVAESASGALGLYTVTDGVLTDRKTTLDENFPVGGFATVCFTSTSDRSRAMVLGGMSRDGRYLNSRWNLEYSYRLDTVKMTNYAVEQPSFRRLIGASVVWYNHRLYLFGGVDENGNIVYADGLYESIDEGMYWSRVNSAKCVLPESLTPRYNTSMLVDGDYIYLYGGQSREGAYADLYRVKLQSISWSK